MGQSRLQAAAARRCRLLHGLNTTPGPATVLRFQPSTIRLPSPSCSGDAPPTQAPGCSRVGRPDDRPIHSRPIVARAGCRESSGSDTALDINRWLREPRDRRSSHNRRTKTAMLARRGGGCALSQHAARSRMDSLDVISPTCGFIVRIVHAWQPLPNLPARPSCPASRRIQQPSSGCSRKKPLRSRACGNAHRGHDPLPPHRDGAARSRGWRRESRP